MDAAESESGSMFGGLFSSRKKKKKKNKQKEKAALKKKNCFRFPVLF